MSPAELEHWFQSTGKPWLLRLRDKTNKIHQVATDALANQVVFWIVVFALLGVVLVAVFK